MVTDQAVADGGKDAAATPSELLVASLASCVAFYAGRYLVRRGLDHAGLVDAGRRRPAADHRAGWRTAALLTVASHCTVLT